MNYILILYNPSYENNVADEHIKILKAKGKVAFGKIRSKHRDMEMSQEQQDALEQMYKSVDKQNYLQLFFDRLLASICSQSDRGHHERFLALRYHPKLL